MKELAKIAEEDEPDKEKVAEAATEESMKAKDKEEGKATSSVERLPSPNRARRTDSPQEEQKVESKLKASASEFVPPGFSSVPKEEDKFESKLKASASEFAPPGLIAVSDEKEEEKAKTKLKATASDVAP